jgi:two-component system chemotaxis response regulator CheB
MPLSVIENIAVDYCIKLKEIGGILKDLVSRTDQAEIVVPEHVLKEAQIAENVATGIDVVSQVADRSVFACPDCGGGLWKVKGEEMHRYRCNIGHAYSINELDVKQGESIESTLWVALRMMEERRALLNKISNDHALKGLSRLALTDKERVNELENHIDKLKELLFLAQKKAV